MARQHLLTQLVQEAAKAKLLLQNAVARDKLAEALKIDPHNMIVTQHIAELADVVGASAPLSPYTASEYSNTVLAPSGGRHDFHVRANASELLRQIFTAYGITAMIDDSVRPQTVRMDADGIGFRKAAELANLLTRTFFVPLDPKRVLIAADTKENRQKYERLFEETVYLPGMTATELTDIGNVVRNIFDAQQSIVQPSAGTVTMRAPEPTLRAVNRMIAGLTGGKGQVLLDVRIYEIGKLRARNIGIQLPQQVTIFNVPTEVSKILAENQNLVNQIITSGSGRARRLRHDRCTSDCLRSHHRRDSDSTLPGVWRRHYAGRTGAGHDHSQPEFQHLRFANARHDPIARRRPGCSDSPRRNALPHHHVHLFHVDNWQ